jgi:pimeloyl-ACP methyl ester carboxylesterase
VFAGGLGATRASILEADTASRKLIDALDPHYRVAIADDCVLDRVEDAASRLRRRKVVLIGGSLGSVATLAWARRHPDRVAGWIGLAPILDLDDIIANDRGSYGGQVKNYAPVVEPMLAESPMRHAADLAFPMRIYWRTLDHIIPPEVTATFAERAPDCELVELLGGHGNPWWPDDFHDQVVSFIRSC